MKTKWYIFLCICLCFVPCFAQEEQGEEVKKEVLILPFKGEIFSFTASPFVRMLSRIQPETTKLLIIEIDTPGGSVDAVLEMCQEVDRLKDKKVMVYAYINGFAWSCGALLSLACDRIYMKEQASIGSAEVKMKTPQGIVPADEKYVSAFRAHFRAYAEHGNYPAALAEAMVDKKLEVKEIYFRGERFFKTNAELEKFREENIDNIGEIIERGTIVKAGEIANFTAREAKEYGFCTEIYDSRNDLLKGLSLSDYPVREIGTSTTDFVGNFFSSPCVRGMLIALGILGIILECVTPGFGVPGIVGILCLVIAFIGGFLAETTALWEILLFLFGIFLLALEIFVIPGFGITGIVGIICCVFALILSLQTFVFPTTAAESSDFITNILIILGSLTLDILILAIIFKFAPKNAPLYKLSVATVQTPEDGYTIAIDSYNALLDKEGVVTSTLRPAGKAKIGEEFYDVTSLGDFLTDGTKIKVIEIRGNQIFVDKIES